MTHSELKEARLRLGLTQTQMADALATPVRTYQGWEAGRYSIPGPVKIAIRLVTKHQFSAKKKEKSCP